jgi:hypothetical protein
MELERANRERGKNLAKAERNSLPYLEGAK